MVRPVTFEREIVIENAMKVFWEKGFQGTTMRDISTATHLNPGSLYGSFGNKRALFFQVLEFYYKKLTEDINHSMRGAATNEAILNDFFEKIISDNEDPDLKGCLLVNCLLEMAHDSEIQANIAAMFSGFEEMFYWIIFKGQKEGTYKPAFDPRNMARYLVNNYFGLRVQCMTEKDTKQLFEEVDNFLSILE